VIALTDSKVASIVSRENRVKMGCGFLGSNPGRLLPKRPAKLSLFWRFWVNGQTRAGKF